MAMANYRLFLGALLVITAFNLVLYIHQRGSYRWGNRHTAPTPLNQQNRSRFSNRESINDLFKLVTSDGLFLIEPSLLKEVIGPDEFHVLQWRFDLPDFEYDNSSITFGAFSEDEVSLEGLSEVARIEGMTSFEPEKSQLLHLFAKWHSLSVHIVFFHRVEHFLWIGEIPATQLAHLNPQFKVHFGKHEEIYDRFELNRTSQIQYPAEIAHFLSQMPTSRYMHCPPERRDWLKKNNILYDISREKITIQSIVSIKSLMKELRMEFWALCGTLLGWYRQCGPIPYTTDNDFSTWPKYLQGEDISSQLRQTAPRHNLKLFYRFGEPYHSMEYSFKSRDNRDKVDMFFTYRNTTHFLLPFHIAWKHVYQYSIYPQYQLCSMQLLGYKLLAPCEAEKVLITEYGPNWDKPKKEYDYAESPFNSSPQYPFPRNMSQYSEF